MFDNPATAKLFKSGEWRDKFKDLDDKQMQDYFFSVTGMNISRFDINLSNLMNLGNLQKLEVTDEDGNTSIEDINNPFNQELEDFRLRPFGQPGQTIRDNMFSLTHSPDLRISRPTNVERELRHFRHSNRGIELAEQLQEQQRQNKINRLIGVSPQKFGSSSNMEEELLLHALKTGNAGPLERFQQPTHGSMIGDMPLQQYEQVYPTMPTPELQASSVDNRPGSDADIFDTVNQRKYGEYDEVYD